MKLLFILRHPTAVRSLHGVFRLLVERGHDVHLGFGAAKAGDAHRVLQRIADDLPGMTFDKLPRPVGAARGSSAGWARLTDDLRLSADGLRYFDPRYDDAVGLRKRGLAKAPPGAVRAGEFAAHAGPRGVAAFAAGVRALERTVAPPEHVERFVADLAPDVLVATHLNEWGSPQADYVRAAKRLGVRTAYLVFSWDNLTNKGLVRDATDLVLVWNEIQKAEAVELQRLPAGRIRVTGAPAYDHWFTWQPSTTREEFCTRVGLDPARPFVLYACSAKFVAPDEAGFVGRWIDALRAHGGSLADAGILVRPHPRNTAQWKGIDLGDPRASIWPRQGEEPVDEESRRHYFDSIYHSAAVFGINTSAQIEAAIVDRPVFTLLADEFRTTQQGTLHFHYLQAEEYGNLHVARTFEEHAAQLEAALDGRIEPLNERFLRRFVRPLGLDVPATPVVVEAIEELGARPAPAPDSGPALGGAARLALTPFARMAGRRVAREEAPDRARRDETPSLSRQLRHALRPLAAWEGDTPVIAGPWLDDEVGELLYWLPFLSWAESTASGLRDRLVVVARPETAAWYAGIGSSIVTSEEGLPAGAPRLEPKLIADHRDVLADDHRGFLGRLLGFARLSPPELDLDLPDRFVAVRFGPEEAAAGVAGLGDVVALDGLDRAHEAVTIARSRGFAGSWGASAVVALLLGVRAVAVAGDLDDRSRLDARVAADFLKPPTFGRLRLVELEQLAEPDGLGDLLEYEPGVGGG